jgi:hypothetical protein
MQLYKHHGLSGLGRLYRAGIKTAVLHQKLQPGFLIEMKMQAFEIRGFPSLPRGRFGRYN